MNETIQIIFGIIFLIMIFLLSRIIMGMRVKQAAKIIMEDLKKNNAYDPASAITLPYAEQSFFKIGMRDFRPKTLTYLVANSIVGKTEENRFFLISDWEKNMSPQNNQS